MSIQIPKRIFWFQESVIRQMSRIAAKEGAINLSQGLPDFSAPAELKRAAVLAIENDHNQYTFTYGDIKLREKISEKLKEKNKIIADPQSEITITCGVSEGIMATCLALLEKGDEVIVFEPYYENYLPSIILAGAKPVFAPLYFPDFQIDFDELAKKFNSRTKAIILNTPMNPSGKVFTKEEMKSIADLCDRWNTAIITDEIYEEIFYDEAEHLSLASLEGMYDKTVSIMGFSKSYAVTGWRIGYVATKNKISDAIRRVHDFMTVCAPTPLQMAALTALDLHPVYYTNMRAMYKKKRTIFCDGLENLSFKLAIPSGAYYVMADYSNIMDDKDDFEFAQFLAEDNGVASVPGSSFYHHKELGNRIVRFSFAVKEETLLKALERIKGKLVT